MARSRQLTETQRAELLWELDSALRIAHDPAFRYSILKKAADRMGQLGLAEHGGWTRAVLEEAIRYAGRNFFKRSLKIEATNSTLWSGVGFDRLPHSPSIAEVIFTLESLDESRSLRTAVTCCLSGSSVTAQGFVGEVTELVNADFTIQNGRRSVFSWGGQEAGWNKAVIAAFGQGGTAGVWTTLDRAWGEIFSRPAAFMKKPLSVVTIQARCQLLEGNSVQVTTASGKVVTGICGGLLPEKPQTPRAVKVLHVNPEGVTEVSFSEIFDLRPYRIVG